MKHKKEIGTKNDEQIMIINEQLDLINRNLNLVIGQVVNIR